MHTTSSLSAWFEGGLSGIFNRREMGVASPTRSYLADLLATFAEASHLTRHARGRGVHRALTDWHLDACTARPAKRREALRARGDLALFVCGVFPGYVATRIAGHEFYSAMGRSAYAELSSAGEAGSLTFAELAEHFASFSEVLGEAVWGRDAPWDPLALYERWLASGSAAARARLTDLGLSPVPAAPADVRH